MKPLAKVPAGEVPQRRLNLKKADYSPSVRYNFTMTKRLLFLAFILTGTSRFAQTPPPLVLNHNNTPEIHAFFSPQESSGDPRQIAGREVCEELARS